MSAMIAYIFIYTRLKQNRYKHISFTRSNIRINVCYAISGIKYCLFA